MSDFFARLVERTFAPAPVVRPLVVSNFAPAILPREEIIATDVPAPVDASPMIFARASQVLPEPTIASEQPITRAIQSPRAPDIPATSRVVRELESPVAATPRVEAELESPIAATPREPRSPLPIAPAASTPREHSPDVEASPVEHSLAFRIEPARAEDDRATSPMLAPARARPITHAATRAMQTISPRIAVAPAPSQESSAPTIHVKIGRIEVRAIVAPPPSPAPAKPKPGLSLEDYLRARNEGTR